LIRRCIQAAAIGAQQSARRRHRIVKRIVAGFKDVLGKNRHDIEILTPRIMRGKVLQPFPAYSQDRFQQMLATAESAISGGKPVGVWVIRCVIGAHGVHSSLD
jgi:hypothetical protein